MNLLHAIILGIVEGLTEFLPISSTGHMILASKLLGLESTEFLKTFEIFIQLGAILSVVVLYFKRLLSSFSVIKNIIIAFIPTAIIGLIFHDFVKAHLLSSYLVVSVSLIVGGIIIILFEKKYNKKYNANIKNDFQSQQSQHMGIWNSELNTKKSLIIGVCQSIAMIPGVSRSAATIIGGQMQGISRTAIVEFSFLLAIPTMLAASVLDLYKGVYAFNYNEFVLLAVGFITAFIVALIAIKKFLKFIQTKDFVGFGVYRIIVGVIFLILFFFGF